MRDDERSEGRWEEYVSVANLVEKDKKESSTCSAPSFSDSWCTSLDNVDTTLNNKFSEVKGREECAGMTHGTPHIMHTRTHTHIYTHARMHAHTHTHTNTPLYPLPLLRPRRLAARYEGEQQHWVKEQEGRGGEKKGERSNSKHIATEGSNTHHPEW